MRAWPVSARAVDASRAGTSPRADLRSPQLANAMDHLKDDPSPHVRRKIAEIGEVG